MEGSLAVRTTEADLLHVAVDGRADADGLVFVLGASVAQVHHRLPPLPRLADMRTGFMSSLGSVSLISIIFYQYAYVEFRCFQTAGDVWQRWMHEVWSYKGIDAVVPPWALPPPIHLLHV